MVARRPRRGQATRQGPGLGTCGAATGLRLPGPAAGTLGSVHSPSPCPWGAGRAQAEPVASQNPSERKGQALSETRVKGRSGARRSLHGDSHSSGSGGHGRLVFKQVSFKS